MKQLKIHTENILPIIKQWLYSEKDIFLRELVSNACDAIQKLKVLRNLGEAEAIDDELRIDITIKDKTLCIADTGLGMDAAEVEKYIGEVAFSGAEEFLKKYETDNEKDQIIGHFGLGFFSSYMVASDVEIQTLSHKKEARPVHWKCDGSSSYSLEEGTREKRGTEVILHISDEEYLDPVKLRQMLNHYCSFLPYPIYLNGDQINKKPPLWIKPASECTNEEYIDFYRHLYPGEEDPLFWIHLNVDYPFHLKGILYFPKIRKELEFSKNSIKLFCNRVFVSDNCKDLIPEYLMVLRGAIDSPDIPLNVSRSTLQMSKTVRQLSSHIAKKVSDRLLSLYKTDAERYQSCWRDIEVVIKLGAIQDEKFYDRVKDAIIWKNIKGEWTTLSDYVERNSPRIFYTGDEKHEPAFLSLYREKEIEVLYTNGYIDNHLINFLERKNSEWTFQRIDGAIDDLILSETTDEEQAKVLAEFVKGALDVEVEAKSLASDTLPGFVLFDEQARRMRDLLSMSGAAEMPMGGPQKFIVNTNSKLICAVHALKDQELAKEILRQVYDQALLSQRELKPEDLDAFLKRNNEVMEKLACCLVSA